MRVALECLSVESGIFKMAKCSNCGLESKHLHGAMGDLCQECNTEIGHIYSPQISQEEIEQNKKKRGDS